MRPGGQGQAWEALEACQADIERWVKQDLTAVKIGVLLQRRSVVVPYRTLHRPCTGRCGFGPKASTMPGPDLQQRLTHGR